MTREFHDGREDGLEPLKSLDLSKVHGFSDLLEQMSATAFGGRTLGEAYQTLCHVMDDPDCKVVVTLSGAMTIAKMGRVLCDMIDNGLAHYIVSTGALMAHGLSEAVGGVHYKHRPDVNDKTLYEQGYNRVYDTLEMEENLNFSQAQMERALHGFDWSRPRGSFEITHAIGEYLHKSDMMPSVLGVAHRRGVPIYVPAFTDSELGLSLSTQAMARVMNDQNKGSLDALMAGMPTFNPFLDLYDITRNLTKAKTLAIFTIGGGVPRNWAQQVAPFVEIANHRLGTDFAIPRYKYAVRICPEPVHWGGLSGCTYSEGVSWGKFVPADEGGRFAEVLSDATLVWPLLIKALLERKERLAKKA